MNASPTSLLAVSNANIVGAVLNDPDGEVARAGGSYYFYGYSAERPGK